MNFTKRSAAALLIYLATGLAPSNAETNDAPWVQIESTSFMIGIGGRAATVSCFCQILELIVSEQDRLERSA
jgi:hypothetical protein